MLLVASLAFVLLAQGPSTAPPADPPGTKEVEGVTVKGDAKDPVVCKTTTALGTKVPKRTCQRKSEIEAQRAEAREFADEIVRKPTWRPRD